MILLNTYKSTNVSITFVFNYLNLGYYFINFSIENMHQRNLHQSMINRKYNLSQLIKVTRDI